MRLVALGLSTILLLTTNIQALDLSVGVSVGKLRLKDNERFNNATTFGIRNSINFTKNFALELKYEKVKANQGEQDGDNYTTSMVYNARGLYPSVVPYILAGIGYEDSDEKTNFYNLAAGLKYYYTPKANISFELGGIKKVEKSLFTTFSLGLGYDFNNLSNKKQNITNEQISPQVMRNIVQRKMVNDDIFLTPY